MEQSSVVLEAKEFSRLAVSASLIFFADAVQHHAMILPTAAVAGDLSALRYRLSAVPSLMITNPEPRPHSPR